MAHPSLLLTARLLATTRTALPIGKLVVKVASHLSQLVAVHLVRRGAAASAWLRDAARPTRAKELLRLRELLFVVQFEEQVRRSLVLEVTLVLTLVALLHAEDLLYLVLALAS